MREEFRHGGEAVGVSERASGQGRGCRVSNGGHDRGLSVQFRAQSTRGSVLHSNALRVVGPAFLSFST